MRFSRDAPENGCCIVVSPEFCPEPVAWREAASGPHACESHKIRLAAPVIARRSLTCDYVLPDVPCQKPTAWDYLEDNGRRQKLCEEHAAEFEAIEPPAFRNPHPDGYDVKRLESA